MADSRRSGSLWLLGVVLILSGCTQDVAYVDLSGEVFGTTWSLTYEVQDPAIEPEQVRQALVAAFDVVNRQMNTYDPDSEISRFNRAAVGEVIAVGWDFAYVLSEALRLTEVTGGAYDTTVSPLANLWGFGPDGLTSRPTPEEIHRVLRFVGSSHLDWRPKTRELSKRLSGTSLDFSSIAKGYGVDLAADALDELTIDSYMLEVGGELRLRGLSPRGTPWRIAIERPGDGVRGVQAAMELSDTGIATSGDYRNYFTEGGIRYSHLIDPRDGMPIRHDLVSVTVVHESTALADAWATALIVLGYERARELADQRDLAVYFVRREEDDFGVEWTSAMATYLSSRH